MPSIFTRAHGSLDKISSTSEPYLRQTLSIAVAGTPAAAKKAAA